MNDLVSVVHAALRMSTPIVYAALGGLIAEGAGVVNIGIEGIMLAGAFVCLVAAWLSGSLWLAALAAGAAGAVLSVLFALLAVRMRANPVVVGLGLNGLVAGGIAYIMQVYFKVRGAFAPPGVTGLPRWDLGPLAKVPFLGPVLSGHTPLVYLAGVTAVATWLILYRTRFGLWLRAAGEEPEAARAAGIPVPRVQTLALVLCGVITAIGGIQLSLGDLTRFNEGMTSGRGFIALAAYYFGQRQPGPTVAAAGLFGFFQALQIRLQSTGYPPQLVQTLPYLIVVLTLSLIAWRRLAIQRRWQRAALQRYRTDAPGH
ncbi:MAG: ABC transporter permease [Bacillota bacterium]|nr:MAG: sugar ABC transporter permease [Bacillota bacterium]